MTIEEELAEVYFKAVEERKTPYERENAYWNYYNNLLVDKFNRIFISTHDIDLLKKVNAKREEDRKTYGDEK